MDIAHTGDDLREVLARWQHEGARVGLVPTMGHLHRGHYALVEQIRPHVDRVIASVFVNPTQFGPNEDFERYPRTLDEDAHGLRAHGCDLLFAPNVATMYPLGLDQAHRLHVPALADVLCGAHRPGHFDGVVTVVSRLYNLTRPDVAIFGEKDFQQLRILERMTDDLGYSIQILRGATVREDDGLALSSRNRYLDSEQRGTASTLIVTLRRLREDWQAGMDVIEAEQSAASGLAEAGFQVDYVEIRQASNLGRPSVGQGDGLRVFAAARLGATRLIDNLSLDSNT